METTEVFLQCDECDWRVYDRGQKMKPKYLLNRHKKKCKYLRKKRAIKYIIEYLQNASEDDVLKVFNYIKQN